MIVGFSFADQNQSETKPMPAIFHREAYEAAAGRAPDVAAFEAWEQLAEALDKLTPEQRCDAVYADWLLQLHSPARLNPEIC